MDLFFEAYFIISIIAILYIVYSGHAIHITHSSNILFITLYHY